MNHRIKYKSLFLTACQLLTIEVYSFISIFPRNQIHPGQPTQLLFRGTEKGGIRSSSSSIKPFTRLTFEFYMLPLVTVVLVTDHRSCLRRTTVESSLIYKLEFKGWENWKCFYMKTLNDKHHDGSLCVRRMSSLHQ